MLVGHNSYTLWHNTIMTTNAAVTPMRRRIEAFGISLVGGALLYLGIRQPELGPLVGAGWVVLMTPAVVERWRSPLIGFFPGLLLSGWILWAPLRLMGWHVLFLIPVLSVCHYGLQPWLARWLMRSSRLPAAIVLPLSVGAAEWSRPLLGFGYFNMFQTGSFLYAYPRLIQPADLVGALGLSVLWTLPWAVLVDLLRFKLGETGPQGRRSILRAALATGVLLVVWIGYGTLRLTNDRSSPGPRIAIVQPNERHSRERTPKVVEAERKLTIDHVPPGSVDLVAWPEYAVLVLYDDTSIYRGVIAGISRTVRAPILLGSEDEDRKNGRTRTSAYLFDDTGTIRGRNYKMYLWPFTERRPLRRLQVALPGLERFVTGLVNHAWGDAPDGEPGTRPRTMTLQTREGAFTFWAPICYETCYAGIAREAAREGAQFFVNITSEGWAGWGFCRNQIAVSALRAVENRVGMVRVGNTGISCFIRPDGRIEKVLHGLDHGSPLLEPGVLIDRVRVDPHQPTLYARFGDTIDLVWPGLWSALLLLGILRRERRGDPDGTPREHVSEG